VLEEAGAGEDSGVTEGGGCGKRRAQEEEGAGAMDHSEAETGLWAGLVAGLLTYSPEAWLAVLSGH
jgi:hypothetical protein